MKEVEYEKLSVFYKMLSDNTRLRILDVLLEESLCVNDICNKLNMSQSAISHQLINLRKENLVKTNKRKSKRDYKRNPLFLILFHIFPPICQFFIFLLSYSL